MYETIDPATNVCDLIVDPCGGRRVNTTEQGHLPGETRQSGRFRSGGTRWPNSNTRWYYVKYIATGEGELRTPNRSFVTVLGLQDRVSCGSNLPPSTGSECDKDLWKTLRERLEIGDFRPGFRPWGCHLVVLCGGEPCQPGTHLPTQPWRSSAVSAPSSLRRFSEAGRESRARSTTSGQCARRQAARRRWSVGPTRSTMPVHERTLSVDEAAIACSVSSETIRRRLRTGRLRGAFREGPHGAWRIPVSDLVDDGFRVIVPNLAAEVERLERELALEQTHSAQLRTEIGHLTRHISDLRSMLGFGGAQ